MNIVSCNNCGVVLDKRKLKFPEDIWTEAGCINPAAAVWDDVEDDFVAFVPCPVCKEPVLENQA